jgi:sortase A
MAFPHLMERAAWSLGIALLLTHGAARLWAEHSREDGIRQFHHPRQAGVAKRSGSSLEHPDRALWSTPRIAAFATFRNVEERAAGVLRIPALELEVPVFEGTDEVNLNRGAGRVEGTAPLGSNGNVGIAAHRDGFFRKLKDAKAGQVLYLDTGAQTLRYLIVDTSIVEPQQVSVLAAANRPTVTLVTCYPFYYVGSAPLRFVVRAESTGTHLGSRHRSESGGRFVPSTAGDH